MNRNVVGPASSLSPGLPAPESLTGWKPVRQARMPVPLGSGARFAAFRGSWILSPGVRAGVKAGRQTISGPGFFRGPTRIMAALWLTWLPGAVRAGEDDGVAVGIAQPDFPVVRPAVVAAAAEQALIPATAGFHVGYADEGLGVHVEVQRLTSGYRPSATADSSKHVCGYPQRSSIQRTGSSRSTSSPSCASAIRQPSRLQSSANCRR